MRERELREEMVSLSRSLYERGYAAGGSGESVGQDRSAAHPCHPDRLLPWQTQGRGALSG